MAEKNDSDPDTSSTRHESRANHLGWAVGFFVAGGLMLAKQFGWIESVDFLLPAVILGLGTAHLCKAIVRG